jgi:hypothetical protein
MEGLVLATCNIHLYTAFSDIHLYGVSPAQDLDIE